MFDVGPELNSSPSSDNDTNYSSTDYLKLAHGAFSSGEVLLAALLYTAAFQKADKRSIDAHADAVDGLRRAMELACECKERSLAEFIFEKLEPYCTAEETQHNASRLQDLALDRLEDFGISRNDIQQMTGLIEGDAFGAAMLSHLGIGARSAEDDGEEDAREADDDASESGKREPGLLIPPSTPFGKIIERRPSDSNASKQKPKKAAENPEPEPVDWLGGFDELVGYDAAIQKMRSWGIGMGEDERFKKFLGMLSRHHGIASLPSLQTMMFRAAAREDATHFLGAVVGEMGLPAVRMYMEESPLGIPMLCIVASGNMRSQLQFFRSGFDAPSVLMMEDVDLWGAPLGGQSQNTEPGPLSQVARGAREAIMFIRSAVENPNVTVVASCESGQPLDPFVQELLSPMEMVEIDLPTGDERAAIWKHAVSLYPSLRYVNMDDLVRFSHSMSRCDIYMAAREAVEQAYQQSVRDHAFVPVTNENIFDKIAAYQPLDSQEYSQMEDIIVSRFSRELEHIDDLLDGEDD